MAETVHTDKLFDTLPRDSTLSQRVTYQLESLIQEGVLKRGDLIPPERELARQFGVSRTVIREAVRSLVARHLLEIRPEGGMRISRPTVKSVARSISLMLDAKEIQLNPDKILEVRRLLEIEIASKAAERRSEENLARLRAIMAQSIQAQNNLEALSRLDVDFHNELAAATCNELFAVLLNSIASVLIRVRMLGLAVPGAPALSIHYHQAILEQVASGDPLGAAQAMKEHLIEGEQTMHSALMMSNND